MSKQSYYSVKEAAAAIDRDPKTIYRWIASGRLQAEARPGRGRKAREYIITHKALVEAGAKFRNGKGE